MCLGVIDMHMLLFQGNRLETTDGVADAVMGYAVALARSNGSDVVEFPVVIDGVVTHTRVLLAPGIGWATVAVPGSNAFEIDGSAQAAREIRHRADELASTFWLS